MAVWQPWVPDEHPRPYHMNVIQVPLGKQRRWWWWWCSWSSTMATQSPWSKHILLALRAIAIVHQQRLTTAANDCFLWLWFRYNFWIVRFSMREHIQPFNHVPHVGPCCSATMSALGDYKNGLVETSHRSHQLFTLSRRNVTRKCCTFITAISCIERTV